MTAFPKLRRRPQACPPPAAAVERPHVALLDEAGWLGPSLGDHYACDPEVGPATAAIVTARWQAPDVARLRAAAPGRAVIVIERWGSSPAHAVTALDAGAATYVGDAHAEVVRAYIALHLDGA
ncbi:MAG TPA: hypothetical protein VFJ85_19110 [Acidimicrobiales bacterium]|nr:hypothetical protein [Acidimicrobiales bacterium]